MSAPNDGGPAFPVHETPDSTDHAGMTLRDYFAAKAMQAYIQAWVVIGKHPVTDDPIGLAAYSAADAMLKAREEEL